MANSSIDLRPWMSPIEHQGLVSSCAPNAIVGAYEYLAYLKFRKHIDFSRLFLYYLARWRDGRQTASSISTNIQMLKEYGICTERTWAYSDQYLNAAPSKQAYAEASNYRLKSSQKLSLELNTLKSCLMRRYPFVFGLKIPKSFHQVDKSGRVVMPNPRLQLSGHAMLCVGYFDQYQVFIVRNSWGKTWGNNGYCYVPYSYLANPNYTSDVHAIYDFGKF
ncbi:MAG: C1 family peptidase [Rivularia sp. (in: cyanobacteria)]